MENSFGSQAKSGDALSSSGILIIFNKTELLKHKQLSPSVTKKLREAGRLRLWGLGKCAVTESSTEHIIRF